MGEVAQHSDPTLEAAAWLEVEEQRCNVCQQRVVFVINGDIRCGEGKRWPHCLSDKKKGFKLDEGV